MRVQLNHRKQFSIKITTDTGTTQLPPIFLQTQSLCRKNHEFCLKLFVWSLAVAHGEFSLIERLFKMILI